MPHSSVLPCLPLLGKQQEQIMCWLVVWVLGKAATCFWRLFLSGAVLSPCMTPLRRPSQCSTRGTQKQRKNHSCPPKAMQSGPQPSGGVSAGSASLSAHIPAQLWFSFLLARRQLLQSGLWEWIPPLWGQDCSVPGTLALPVVLMYGFILGAETMGFEGLQPGDEATLVSCRESQNTDLVNDGFSSSPAPFSPSLKSGGPNHFDSSVRGHSKLRGLPFLQQQELEIQFSLGQADLLRQIEWSILTTHLTGMDVFVKRWTVSFYYYFSTLCCRTLFLFLNSLQICYQHLGKFSVICFL